MPELAIIHHGAPRTLREFMKSEVWHGRGDWYSVATVRSSRVALASLVFLALHSGVVLALFFGSGVALAAPPLVAILGMCVVSAVFKFAAHRAAIRSRELVDILSISTMWRGVRRYSRSYGRAKSESGPVSSKSGQRPSILAHFGMNGGSERGDGAEEADASNPQFGRAQLPAASGQCRAGSDPPACFRRL